MIRVAKQHVAQDVLCNIDSQFEKAILSLKNSTHDARYLNELFTDSERLVLAKRLSLIMMLIEDYRWADIRDTLQVSKSTINTVAKDIDAGRYATIIAALKKERSRTALWKDLEYIVKGTRT